MGQNPGEQLKMAVYQLRGHKKLVVGHLNKKILIDHEKNI